MNAAKSDPLQKIRKRIKRKIYQIDPEPLLGPWKSLILLLVVTILSALSLAIMLTFLEMEIAFMLTDIAFSSVLIFIIVLAKRYPLSDLIRIRNFMRIDLNLIAIFSAIFMAILGAIMMHYVEHLFPFSEKQIEFYQRVFPSMDRPFLIVFLNLALIPGFCEEILIRGVIQPAFIKRFGPVSGITAAALLFALIHVNIQQIVVFFPLGIYLGLLAYRGGSFLYSALAHIVYNSAVIFSNYLNEADSITIQNGGFSITITLLILFVFVILILLLMRITPKRVIGKPHMYYI